MRPCIGMRLRLSLRCRRFSHYEPGIWFSIWDRLQGSNVSKARPGAPIGSYRRSALGLRNRGSLHYATPDFLLMLVALRNFMRLSLLKAAHAVVYRAMWQEIRVRSGRDDNFVWR